MKLLNYCEKAKKEIIEQHNFNYQEDYLDWLKDKQILKVCPYSNGEGCVYTCLLK